MPKPNTLTPRQAEALNALAYRSGDHVQAAKDIGMRPRDLLRMAKVIDSKQALGDAAPPAGWQPVQVSSDSEGRVRAVRSRPDVEPQDDPTPPGHLVQGVSTLLDADGVVRQQWVKTKRAAVDGWEAFWAAATERARAIEPLALVQDPDYTHEELCAIYPLGDPHIGMLSWHSETGRDFDLHLATEQLEAVVDALVSRAPAARIAYLVNVGDFFHADTDAQVTPKSGHKLDVDSRKAKVARMGFAVMRRLVQRLLERHAEVRVINARGNHDPEMSLMLSLWLEATFCQEPRVKVLPAENPYQYFTFGSSLLGVHHGDGAKPDALPQIMATDMPQAWGAARYRYWLTGHIHHQTRKEHPGCVVESFRTLAAQDYWHHQKGYRSGRSLDCIVLHKEWGEFARLTVDLASVVSE